MKFISMTAFAIAMAATHAVAEEKHRELGPHVHGHGTFNIAIENGRVSMELETPGMDIVGFEHAAESSEQKATVAKATERLGKPLELFKMPLSSGCKVAQADVKIEKEHEHEHDADEDHADASTHGASHAHDGKADHDHEGHNEFHVAYALDCTSPASLTSIQFDYFKAFKGANSLTVNIVTPKGQSTYEVSRAKPVLDLGGMM